MNNLVIICAISFFALGCSKPTMTLKRANTLKTADAYRAFLFHSENDDERFAAKLQLERLLFARAQKSTGIAPVITFLHEFPKGRYHKEARSLLAQRRAERALASTEVWPLVRFLHFHPRHRLAPKISAQLESRWFADLKKNPSSDGLRRYLDYFPSGIHYRQAMESLADLELAKLGNNPSPTALRLLSIAYAQTKAGKKAKQLLARIHDLEIVIAGELHAVVALLMRENSLPREMVSSALHRHLQSAVLALNHTKVEQVCSLTRFITCAPPLKRAMVRWAKLSKAKRAKLSKMVVRAAPFKPMASFKTLRLALNAGDLRTTWTALNGLALINSPKGFFTLLPMIGDPDFAIFSMAQESLDRFFARKLPWTKHLVRYAMSRLKANLGEPRFFLQAFLILEATGEKQRLMAALRKGTKADEYALHMEFLRVLHIPGWNPDQLIRLINREAARLTKSFPLTVDKASYIFARSLARRLYALLRAMGRVSVSQEKFAMLKSHITVRHKKWDTLLQKFPSFESSEELPLLERVQKWNLGQVVAQKRLSTLPGAEGAFWRWFFTKK